jgi:DNA-binding NtrC family response regulator
VDVRVIVATHHNLEQLVREGRFRQDLFHRIYVFPLTLPPLRERREEIPGLVEHFARRVAEQNGWKPMTFAPEAIAELEQYAWPGNVRELRNVVERLMLLATGGQVDAETVRLALPSGAGAPGAPAAAATGDLSERMDAFERAVILAELERQHHHVTNTAKALGLERSHLYKKCQQLGIELSAGKKER